VKVVHKQNGGLSDARNAGLERAQGEWVTFVDSDDFVENDTYAPLLRRLETEADIDLIEYPVLKWFGSPMQKKLTFDDKNYCNPEKYWIDGEAYDHCYAWNKIYRRSLFEGVRFPKGKLFEDVWTLSKIIRKAKRMTTTSTGCYVYCWNPDGITANATGETLRQLLEAHLDAYEQLEDKSGEEIDLYYLRMANIQSDVCEKTGEEPRLPARRTALSTALKHPKLMFIKIFGVKQFCLCNRLIHKMRTR